MYPQDFFEEIDKTTTLLGVKDHQVVRIAAYQFKVMVDLQFKGVEKVDQMVRLQLLGKNSPRCSSRNNCR